MGIGAYRHRVLFQVPASTPDGDGGYVEAWQDLDPPWWVSIRPATVRDLERAGAATVIATATHILEGRYRPDVGIDARIMFGGRTMTITNVQNLDERGITMRLLAVETV